MSFSDKKNSISTKHLHNIQEYEGGVSFNVSKTGLIKKKRQHLSKVRQSKHIAFSELSVGDSDDISDKEEEIVKIDYEHFGYWGTHGFDKKFWPDDKRPVVKFKSYENLKLNEKEKDGYLTDRIIAACSSYLDKCPGTGKYALCKCVLRSKKIKDISILYYHHFLQYIDLSFNNLEDISALGGLPYLMYLDASHNKLRTLLDFKPPMNLTFVDYSYNFIREIKDLTPYWSIKVLNLSYNFIEVISGLENLRYLETLNLAHNKIKGIENLNNLRIINLNLQNNMIHRFEHGDNIGFKTMPYLSYVRLGRNNLKSLKLFEGAIFIQSIDLEGNHIADLFELTYLKDLRLLVYLNLKKNQIRDSENYELVCLNTVKNLNILDGLAVYISQKVLATDSLSPNIRQRAARDHANLLIQSHFTDPPPSLEHYTPVDEVPTPLVVVVAPAGSRHTHLIKQLAGNHEHVIRLITHTTRRPVSGDTTDEYHYVSHREFGKLVQRGEFVMVYEMFGCMYGLARSELARGLATRGKVMITHADLQAALTLRLGGHRPWLLLAMPSNTQTHKNWLTEIYRTCILNPSYPEAAITICRNRTIENDASRYISIYTNVLNEKIAEDNCFYYCWKEFSDLGCGDVNSDQISQTSVEHYGELMDMFYNNILEKRDEYMEYHNKNPGVFYDSIFTDEVDESMEKLNKLVAFILEVQRYAEPLEKTRTDKKYEAILQHKLNIFQEQMKSAQNVSLRWANREEAEHIIAKLT